MIGNLRPQLAHPATHEIQRAILETREHFGSIARRTGASIPTVQRIAQRLRSSGIKVPKRGRLCATCREVFIRKPGVRSCFDCRLAGERIRIGKRECSNLDCERDAYTHGLCRRCYQRKAVLGTPEKRAAHSRRVIENRKRREERRAEG